MRWTHGLLVFGSLALAACSSSSSSDGGVDAGTLDGEALDVAFDAPVVDAFEPPIPDADVEDSEMPTACETDGQTRSVECGACGLRAETCVAGSWEPTSECLDEGACMPGEVEDETRALCDTYRRICDSTCNWRDWSTVTPPGECSPGEERLEPSSCGFSRDTCSASCEWVTLEECTDGCNSTGRTTPALAEEVCIPPGEFVRGTTLFEDASPVRTIRMSPFYIDRYLVTNQRYIECMEAGACTEPDWDIDPPNDDDANRPVMWVSIAQARVFCAWDGGRRLPTEAEWERAARGDAPQERTHPWGETLPSCAIYPFRACPSWDGERFPFDVDETPFTASPFGVQQMTLSVYQWIDEPYVASFYATSPDTDPIATTGSVPQARGVPFTLSRLDRESSPHLSRRLPAGTWFFDQLANSGIRCARGIP